MSSRALRRLQKEQELEKQLAVAQGPEKEDELDDEAADVQNAPKPRNAFEMLDGAEAEASDQDEDEDISNLLSKGTSLPSESISPPPSKAKKKKKKKAKKKLGEAGEERQEESQKPRSDAMDEIDRALKDLSTKYPVLQESSMRDVADYSSERTQFLGVESKNLNPATEMRSLFGNVALEESSSRTSPRNQRRQEQFPQGGVDLGTALLGRYSPSRKELGALASRRNVFMHGKSEWPLGTSGGLSMDASTDSGEKEFNITHNSAYQETSVEFRICVESMEPQNMVSLLMLNPYHIAALLQVSEIAKHQGDHSVSADLLERALFTFGRSVHSSFPSSLRQGTARVPFRKPANRELYLTIWRYVRNLEMRGTWRTAFEWTKVLLQLDPTSDPFGATLMIDQFALRGRQQQVFIDMCSAEAYGQTWSHLPNIQISLALAYVKAGEPQIARQKLAYAMHAYPYVLSRLASVLEIDPLPPNLWGKFPSTDPERLYTELYALRAKDLWNTPENTSLLVEVAETLSHYPNIPKSDSPPQLEISLEEARHIMALEIPQLIAFLPRRFTNMPTSSFDVLPPPSSPRADFVARAPGTATGPGVVQNIITSSATAATNMNGLLNRVLEWFRRPAVTDGTPDEEGIAVMEALRARFGDDVDPQALLELRDSVDRELLPAEIGDFDFYADAAREHTPDTEEDDDDGEMPELEEIRNGPFSDEDDNGSIPELEAIHDGPTTDIPAGDNPTTPRNPHAATVEEQPEDDGDDAPTTRETTRPVGRSTTGRAVLRHIDSDSEEEDDPGFDPLGRLPSPDHPRATHTIFAPRSSRGPAGGPSSSAPAATTTRTPPPPSIAELHSGTDRRPRDTQPDPVDTDPQRTQRWLLSAGLAELQAAFSDPGGGGEARTRYAGRLALLPRPQREWVVGVLRQRGVAEEVREWVRGRVGS